MEPSLISVKKIPTLITEILLGRSTDIFLREYDRYTCGYLILYVTCLLCITTSLLLIITGICVNFTSLSTPRQCHGHGSTSNCPRCMRFTSFYFFANRLRHSHEQLAFRHRWLLPQQDPMYSRWIQLNQYDSWLPCKTYSVWFQLVIRVHNTRIKSGFRISSTTISNFCL